MKLKMMKRALAALVTALMLPAAVPAMAEAGGGILRIENGAPQPFLKVTNLRSSACTNEDSDIIRFCVYVEKDNDTDGDGLADLVKVLMQVPRPAVEGKYKAATIYDPTPYGAGTYYDPSTSSYEALYREERFDYDSLCRPCEKRETAGEWSTLEAAAAVRPDRDWNYTVPLPCEDGRPQTGFAYAGEYDGYLARGYAVAECRGIGTYGSEGFELCGTHLERDSHKAVVEWLAGDRRAFTDRVSNIEIRAD